jgi:hypothetical protein
MKRMTNKLPSGESQKPSTPTDEALPAREKVPVKEASVNGFPTPGWSTLALISIKR